MQINQEALTTKPLSAPLAVVLGLGFLAVSLTAFLVAVVMVRFGGVRTFLDPAGVAGVGVIHVVLFGLADFILIGTVGLLFRQRRRSRKTQ